jgi:RNA polymerase sigma-70 factor (ECF subfamily)
MRAKPEVEPRSSEAEPQPPLDIGGTAEAVGAVPTRPIEPPRPSFRQIYDEHFAFVWRAVAYRGVPQSAMDDVVQEVFLVVHRKLDEFEGRSTLRTWLSAIVRNVVADHLRKRGNQRTGQENIDEQPLRSAHDPGRALEQRDDVALCEQLLSAMNDVQREVFVLYELQQLTTREIAELTDTNENTVHTRLKAARKLFQSGLQRYRAQSARKNDP